MTKEPYERIMVRKILREIFASETEDILREKILELGNFVKVEDGTLKVNDTYSVEKWKEA